MNNGKVSQVIGPVVDVEFPAGQLPAIFNALKIRIERQGDNGKKAEDFMLTTEVATHL